MFLFITKNNSIRRYPLKEELQKQKNILDLLLDWGQNQDAFDELLNYFNIQNLFDNPKPTELIKNVILSSTNKNDLILDFFAGSGTTGDAVMQLNKEDGGNRKFILVQWDENIKEGTEAYKFCVENHFEPVISSICIERLNRAGEKLQKDNEGNKLDTGYKVFSLTEKPRIAEDEGGLFKVTNERQETINTLYNMLCATCKPLHAPIETLIKDKLYKADDEMYILGEVNPEELEKYKDLKINVDGWSDISLENWLNLEVGQKDNITVVY